MRSLLAALFLTLGSLVSAQVPKPNIIFILADDLGYGELGSYGQKLIATPNLDRLAAEGIRFTQFYAGSAVCAPSRSVLMTGQHTGHTRVRGNAGANSAAQQLTAKDTTVAHVLQRAGYATGMIGKWGLGGVGDAGEPRQQGFDYFYGFLSQTQAHNHYPNFLFRNGAKITLPNDLKPMGTVEGVGYSTNRVAYAGDLFAGEARDFIERNKAKQFALFLTVISPHANNERSRELNDGNEVPDQGQYADRPWNDAQKNHAAMVSRLDRDVGAILAQLKQLGLDEKTIILFSSDNGAHREGGPNYEPEFFNASGPLTGIKRDLTEGGIRVPFLARWPGQIKAGTVSNHVGYFGDIMATFAELAGGTLPTPVDSISFVPTLLDRPTQPKHDYLYWEFYEGGVSHAVLLEGRWKAIRLKNTTAPVQLYDLATDLGEKNDIAAKNAPIVARAIEIMRTAHVDNEFWKIPAAK